MRQKRKLKRTRGCDFIGDRNVVEFRDVKIGVDDGNVVRIESGLKVVLNVSSQIGCRAMLWDRLQVLTSGRL
jgi:hypothetical protein